MKPCSIVNASWSTFASGATELRPRQLRRVAHLELPRLVAGDANRFLARLHLVSERTEHRVVLEQVGHRLRVADVVEGHHVEVASPLQMRAEEVATDAPEAVDAHADPCHLSHWSVAAGESNHAASPAERRAGRGSSEEDDLPLRFHHA